jgi:hypothetical protein
MVGCLLDDFSEECCPTGFSDCAFSDGLDSSVPPLELLDGSDGLDTVCCSRLAYSRSCGELSASETFGIALMAGSDISFLSGNRGVAILGRTPLFFVLPGSHISSYHLLSTGNTGIAGVSWNGLQLS